MACEAVYNYKYSFYFGENEYAFGICYISKEFIMPIRHLENIIWQRLQQALVRKPASPPGPTVTVAWVLRGKHSRKRAVGPGRKCRKK